MTQGEGRGVQVLKRLLDAALERMPRGEARSCIDRLEGEEAADLARALSSAGVATGSGGNLLYESLADRVSAPDNEAILCGREWMGPGNTRAICLRHQGHGGVCSTLPEVPDLQVVS